MNEHFDFIPLKIADIRGWAVNYKAEIAISANSTALGLSPTQVTDRQAICDLIIASIDDAAAAKVIQKQKIVDRGTALDLNIGLLRDITKNDKTKTGYTPGVGTALRIVGGTSTVDVLTVKTTVTVAKIALGIDIKFDLKGCEGGNIYCKRGSETTFKVIKYIIHPHAVDTRPNELGAASEQRQYYVVLVIDDAEVGLPSDIVTISN